MLLRGFTLIELLIVIAILSILSTLGIANFQTARIKARDLERKADLQTIAKSLETYANDHRLYPLSDTNGQIICQPNSATICTWGHPFTDGNTIYAVILPIDPGSNYSYLYNSTDGKSYTLYAHLENTHDPSLTTFTPTVYCGGTNLCNYKLSSSNLP